MGVKEKVADEEVMNAALQAAKTELLNAHPSLANSSSLKIKMATRAASELIKKKRAVEVLAITDDIPVRRRPPRMVVTRMRALVFAQKKGLMQKEGRALLKRKNVPPMLLKTAERLMVSHDVTRIDPIFRDENGDIFTDFPTMLESWTPDLGSNEDLIKLFQGLHTERGGVEEDLPAFLAEASKSMQVKRSIRDLNQLGMAGKIDMDDPAWQSEDGKRMLALSQDYRRRVVIRLSDAVLAAAEKGHSILVVGSHLGTAPRLYPHQLGLSMPMASVGNGGKKSMISSVAKSQEDDGTGDATTGTEKRKKPKRVHLQTVGDFQMEFLKLCKSIRKKQHMISILPDGAAGGEKAFREVLGHTLAIGQGAVTLGWYGRAATFFLRSKWVGGSLVIEPVAGPVCDQTAGKEVWADQFNDFYAECYSAILSGPPIDIGKPSALMKSGKLYDDLDRNNDSAIDSAGGSAQP